MTMQMCEWLGKCLWLFEELDFSIEISQFFNFDKFIEVLITTLKIKLTNDKCDLSNFQRFLKNISHSIIFLHFFSFWLYVTFLFCFFVFIIFPLLNNYGTNTGRLKFYLKNLFEMDITWSSTWKKTISSSYFKSAFTEFFRCLYKIIKS